MSEEYLSLLKDLNHALSYLSLADLTDVDEQIIKVIVAERLELESRKDKLVVGSQWECVAGCDSKHFVYDVGDVVEVLCVENGHILLKHYAIRDDVIKEQQFLLCFKPKGENE